MHRPELRCLYDKVRYATTVTDSNRSSVCVAFNYYRQGRISRKSEHIVCTVYLFLLTLLAIATILLLQISFSLIFIFWSFQKRCGGCLFQRTFLIVPRVRFFWSSYTLATENCSNQNGHGFQVCFLIKWWGRELFEHPSKNIFDWGFITVFNVPHVSSYEMCSQNIILSFFENLPLVSCWF